MKDIPRPQPTDATAASRPLLVYDGDCTICAFWVRYWQYLTGQAVDYRPYQEVAAQYPGIALPEFQRASQYIAPDGRYAGAAEASFRVLSHPVGALRGLSFSQKSQRDFGQLACTTFNQSRKSRKIALEMARLNGRVSGPRFLISKFCEALSVRLV